MADPVEEDPVQDPEEAFKQLIKVRRITVAYRETFNQHSAHAEAQFEQLSRSDALVVSSTKQLTWAGQMAEFRGTLYVLQGASPSRAQIQAYRADHPDIEVITNVVIR